MLAFADVVHFLAYEFAGLRRRRFAGTLVLTSSSDRFFFGHYSPPCGRCNATEMPAENQAIKISRSAWRLRS
jgi:hypothetical protein